MNKNAKYYRQNAVSFFEATVSVNMSPLHEAFLSKLPTRAHVLDAGCGSGRDAKVFADLGHVVSAFDASADLARLASAHCGFEVAARTFAEVTEVEAYDGIWCCASLLHVPAAEMASILRGLWRALRPRGCLYLSFKLGAGERADGGRDFTDTDEVTLRGWLDSLPHVAAIETWITEDQRPDRFERWINALVVRAPAPARKLVTGGDDPFLPHLSQAMARATEIDIAVAFIKTTGLRLLMSDLLAALLPPGESGAPLRRVRVLTSDYLDVTDPEALRLLLLLQDRGADVRVYVTQATSFHLKAYVFAKSAANELIEGTAFIGSSNISRQALQDGLEWNYRVAYPGDPGFLEARQRFGELFAHSRTVPLSDRWIESYELRRVPQARAVAPDSQEQELPPEPTSVQLEALAALADTRDAGFQRGLVVLATGLGKTWLAAFDATRMGARRVLFVAHREEILSQAAQTFLRIRPKSRVALYRGQSHDVEVDVLCASVQTLARTEHLERFAPQHFDYVVIDEFHHAAAATYRRVLGHFAPAFLLGLTATPDRTDQSDILSLCDDNLVFTRNLFEGIQAKLLAPFHYHGILDESVDYREVPWRNGRFDPEQLSNKLATLARSRHAVKEWRAKAQKRTLAFCVSVVHAEFMAAQFEKAGIASAAVYSGSSLGRSEALERLREGQLSVIFSVDLFNEGVDLPSIDTVMMLRPTESKILFLQQLGRGLRRADQKQHLVVLDFIGNHQSFLQKPQALFGVGATYKALAAFGRSAEEGRLDLPDGCYVNYDLKIIEFLKSLDSAGTQKDYEALRVSLGHRPTLAEFYRSGASVQAMRQRHGSWFALVEAMGDLDAGEIRNLSKFGGLLKEVEVTPMTRSFKMILLEALLELDGLANPPTIADLSHRSWQVLRRRNSLLADLPESIAQLPDGHSDKWQRYWLDNPINAWVGGNRSDRAGAFFRVENNRFHLVTVPPEGDRASLEAMLQELIDYRLAAYEVRSAVTVASSNVIAFTPKTRIERELPYFPNLKIACGHFRAGRADVEEYRALPASYGQLDPTRHFIARASGHSMDGGKNPIRDGDYLLLELVGAANAGSITGTVMAIERQDELGGDNQYLLRTVTKQGEGRYVLKANNPDYEDLPATDDMRTLARLKAVVDPMDLNVGQSFAREDIPALFGESFNAGSWHVGHVVLNEKKVHVLLVTLNKQGKAQEHRFHDHWIDENTFHWQSQNATMPASKRGQEIIQHKAMGIDFHLFVRETKLEAGKGAPFVYQGKASYQSHTGSSPMSVTFSV
jgi:superfamily II DNA or RNA helicase/HKD family nuclease/SOS-response transcriptional repressor LexA